MLMKMSRCYSMILSLLLTLTVAVAAPVTMQIDNTHSSVTFSVPFFGVSEVTGRFERFCGNFLLDDANLPGSKVTLFIDASSVNTGLKIRDRDLAEKYLEVKQFPIIYFTSRSIKMTRPKQFEIEGDLILHGVTKQLKLVLTTIGEIGGDKPRELGLKLQPLDLNRTDFQIMKGSMGSGSVGDTVTVSAVIRVRDVSPYRKDLDVKYPEKTISPTVPFAGSFGSQAGARVALMAHGGNYFLSFSDDEWNWFAQAKVVGPNLYKLVSFGTLVEVKSGTLIMTAMDKAPETFAKRE
jgi:polyisoprenoid-binding protein YceI